MICDTVLDAVGKTPLVRLHRMLLSDSDKVLLVRLCTIVFFTTELLGNPQGSVAADTELAALTVMAAAAFAGEVEVRMMAPTNTIYFDEEDYPFIRIIA